MHGCSLLRWLLSEFMKCLMTLFFRGESSGLLFNLYIGILVKHGYVCFAGAHKIVL